MSSVRTLAATLCVLSGVPYALGGESLHIVERPLTDAIFHVSSKADAVGDIMAFANPVYDSANAHRIGTAQGSCVRVLVGESWECAFTIVIANDRITLQGSYNDAGDSVFVVTGGSGRYLGAKGAMKVRLRDSKKLPTGEAAAYDMFFDFADHTFHQELNR
jgi:allene oxide cyclase